MNTQLNSVNIEAVKKTYHFYAPFYDFLFGSTLEPGRRALSAKVRKLKPSTLLEVGVGTGILLSQYPTDTKIVGIDFSDEMLSIAINKIPTLNNKTIDLMLMDAEQMSFADNAFDCVVMPYILSVTPNPSQLLTEARRVCKQNGCIMIVNHFSGSSFWWFLEKLFKNAAEKIGFRSEFSYETHIESQDWLIEKVTSVNLFNLSKLIIIKNIK